jgi:hypothetical protein
VELVDVVNKLVGPIEPIGKTEVDEVRLNNLKVLTSLADELIGQIRDVSLNKSRCEHSMKICGEHAYEFLREVRLSIDVEENSESISSLNDLEVVEMNEYDREN